MAMTELEMSETLGLMLEPTHNRVICTPDQVFDIQRLTRILRIAGFQKAELGTLNEDMWLEFIPWHSLN